MNEHPAVGLATNYLEGEGAGQALEHYLSDRFTGGAFETVGRPRPAQRDGAVLDPEPNRLTIEDVLALALLGKRVDFNLVHGLRGVNGDLERVLRRIDPELSITTAPRAVQPYDGVWADAYEAFRLVTSARGIGRTYGSKILSRKRPHLIPSGTESSRNPSA